MNIPKTVGRFLFSVFFCLGFSAAEAWDPNKPFIYEMRIAMEADNWFNFYSTATVLSKSDNTVAFRVVANSTTSPTYQLVVTTQGNVGIGTASPTTALVVVGTVTAASFSGSGANLTGVVPAPSSAQEGDLLYYSNGAWSRLPAGTDGSQSLKPVYDSYTKLLLHMEGSGNSFSDSAAGKTVTANGDAAQISAQYKFGSKSAVFDGTGDYISLADSDDWNMGTGDWTIDFWINFNSIGADGSYPGFIGQTDGNAEDWVIGLSNYYPAGTHKLRMDMGGSGQYGNFWMTNNWAAATGTWYHLAFVRSGGNAYIFINGVSQALTTETAWGTFPDSSAVLAIGSHVRDSQAFNGWLDEVRISKGVARWTANFTPPSAPYAATSIGWQ